MKLPRLELLAEARQPDLKCTENVLDRVTVELSGNYSGQAKLMVERRNKVNLQMKKITEAKQAPEFLHFVMADPYFKSEFRDLEELEDMCVYAYLDDLTLDALAEASAEKKVTRKARAKALALERAGFVISTMDIPNDRSRREIKTKMQALAAKWAALVAPVVLKIVGDLK